MVARKTKTQSGPKGTAAQRASKTSTSSGVTRGREQAAQAAQKRTRQTKLPNSQGT